MPGCLARIASSIKGIAPLVLAIGCEQTGVPASQPPAHDVPASELVSHLEEHEPADPQPLGLFTITFYYMIGEEELTPKPANDNVATDETLAAVTGTSDAPKVSLYEPDTCEKISDVTAEFASALALQGSGKLLD